MSHEAPKTPTYNQIQEQLNAGHYDPNVLVRRSDGRIETGVYSNLRYAGNNRQWVKLPGGEAKPVAFKDLTDESQAELADELAASANLPSEAFERREHLKVQVELGKEAVENALIVPGEDKEAVAEKKLNRLKRVFGFPDENEVDYYGKSLRERTSVTEESAKEAAEAYRYSDREIKALFREYRGDAYREEDMAEVLRQNDTLRLELGKLLLDKIDKDGAHLPERIRRNSEKAPNFPGFAEKLTSREYVALLALSMLDGTFKSARSDKIHINRFGEVMVGQHRWAAYQVIGAVATPLVEDKVEREQIR